MVREIQILNRYGCYETKSFVFSGGEVQVQIPEIPAALYGDVTLVARLQSSDDIMRLLMATDIVGRHSRSGWRRLVVPYFPYARQDRVMQPGEAFSLKSVARLINGLQFDEVVVCDPHSDVTPAVVDRIRVVAQCDLVWAHEALQGLIGDRQPLIISPDAGAAKKAQLVAKTIGRPLLTAGKVRDVSNGAITGTRLDDPEGMVRDRSCLIVDDICDGGRTFIELAKVLRENGAERVYLYVTHGIFSKGLGVFRGILDGIYTTDSFLTEQADDPHGVSVYVLPINKKGLIYEA